jgi:hypothetical protein
VANTVLNYGYALFEAECLRTTLAVISLVESGAFSIFLMFIGRNQGFLKELYII